MVRRVLSMTWDDLAFAHWPVDPGRVAESLPAGLEVATHDGRAWLGAVPFVNRDVRPRFSPVGFTFPELNLRTYVRPTAGGPKGVYFYNLDADDRLAVTGARRGFFLPYYRADMRVDRDGDAVTFRSHRTHRGAPSLHFDATYRPTGPRFEAETGSLAEFLAENYRFYTSGVGRVWRCEVRHDPWPLRPGEIDLRTNDLFTANGFDRPEGDPLVHVADDLDVVAGPLRPVRGTGAAEASREPTVADPDAPSRNV